MSGTALSRKRVTITPAHLIRAGAGLDAVRLEARGFGFVIGSLGLLRVRGTLDTWLLRRFRSQRCRALFIGLHGIAWASVRLAPEGRALVPTVSDQRTPEPPVVTLPRLDLHLTVSPPEPP